VQTAGYVIIGILIQLVLIKIVQVYTRKKRNFKYTFWNFFAGVELFLISTASIYSFDAFFEGCHGTGCGFALSYTLFVCWIFSALLISLSLIFFLLGAFRMLMQPEAELSDEE
jgi:hypothetical protein